MTFQLAWKVVATYLPTYYNTGLENLIRVHLSLVNTVEKSNKTIIYAILKGFIK